MFVELKIEADVAMLEAYLGHLKGRVSNPPNIANGIDYTDILVQIIAHCNSSLAFLRTSAAPKSV